MRRLLCILSSMDAGGAETFLMKIYRNIDRTKYQMDFCINVKKKCFYEDEILKLGGKIFRIPSKSDNLKQFKKQLYKIVRDNKYEHVLRITSNAMGFLDLKIAKKAGARVCCARSSNASDGNSLISKIVHKIGRMMYQKYVDVALAPSDLAAEYTFGKKAYRKGLVSILHNAVDLNVFCYNEEKRFSVRQELGIMKDAKVVGHVGRFAEQKNHMFLAEIFKEICRLEPDAVLLLVGDGPLKSQFEDKIKRLGLEEQVVFAGVRSDVPHLLSSMDVFVFPSLYEGMPNTVIEAQATGLPCIISDTITKEANITGIVEFESIKADAKRWATLAMTKISHQRRNTINDFQYHKYDIDSTVEEFINIILLNK